MPLPSAEEYRSRAMAILERAERLPIGIDRTRLLKIASRGLGSPNSKTTKFLIRPPHVWMAPNSQEFSS